MKYSSIKAPNASIYTNQIKNGNKIEKTPNNIQQMELNTIWGLFDKIINNNTKKTKRKWLNIYQSYLQFY